MIVVSRPDRGGPDLEQKIEFVAGLPGFAEARGFQLEALPDGAAPFIRLRSVEGPDLAFTVVEPGRLLEGYSIEIEDDDQEKLGIESPAEVLALAIVTVPAPPAPATANLLGPIVINRRTGAAAQVVQRRSTYEVAKPILPPA